MTNSRVSSVRVSLMLGLVFLALLSACTDSQRSLSAVKNAYSTNAHLFDDLAKTIVESEYRRIEHGGLSGDVVVYDKAGGGPRVVNSVYANNVRAMLDSAKVAAVTQYDDAVVLSMSFLSKIDKSAQLDVMRAETVDAAIPECGEEVFGSTQGMCASVLGDGWSLILTWGEVADLED